MCFGDMTLEGARVEEDGTRVQVDGWGTEHQCRRWVSKLMIPLGCCGYRTGCNTDAVVTSRMPLLNGLCSIMAQEPWIRLRSRAIPVFRSLREECNRPFRYRSD